MGGGGAVAEGLQAHVGGGGPVLQQLLVPYPVAASDFDVADELLVGECDGMGGGDGRAGGGLLEAGISAVWSGTG